MAVKVIVVMGSNSDFDIMKPTFETLKEFGVEFEAHVASAHRTPDRALSLAKEAHTRGVEVIIAAAGAAAHLAGVLAAATPLPVIGVPIDATPLRGVDALYAMVQMPAGVPVAVMAINGARNAALFAVQLLGAGDPSMRERYLDFKARLAGEVLQRHENLNILIKEMFE